MQPDPQLAAAAWDSFVADHSHGHLLQSACWGAFRRRQGWRVRRVQIPDSPAVPVAAAQVFLRTTPLGDFAYVPRGPVVEPENPEFSRLWSAVRRAAQGAVAIRAEPNWLDTGSTRAWLQGLGLRESVAAQPPSTVRVNLKLSEDELLGAMKSKWRYNVRLAPRRDVVVEEAGERQLPEFYGLLAVTAERDEFTARPRGYYADAWRSCSGHSHLYLARHEGTPLAAIMVFHFGDTATYLYGASSNHERQRMPNHLLQWEAMRRAKLAGCAWYDFWGIPDEVGRAWARGEDPDEVPAGDGGLWGVWHFKRGFGGEVIRTVGAWDDVLAGGRYQLGKWGLRLLDSLRAARSTA